MKKPTKKRDPEATKRSILEAAVKEFSTYGLGGARVDRIAERADANKRMLYHYFGNKDALFLAALEEAYTDIRNAERKLELENVDPVDSIRRLVTFTWDYYEENPHFLSLLNSENLHKAVHIKRSKHIQLLHSPFVEMLRRIIEKGQNQKVFRARVDPVQLYMSIASVCYFYFSNIHTLSVIFGRDLSAEEAREERRNHAVEVILGYLRV
ncbi:MAG: TetR family transcriptional regulator [Rhodospirillales bacterium]|nr:TetR family transcriptional regulator [Rhodospirillales bacterium]